MTTEKPVEKSFEVYNGSDEVITFTDSIEGPSHITVRYEPAAISPKEKGQLILTYNPAKKNNLGFNSDNIVVYTDEQEQHRKQFYVMATVEEYFPPMTDDELAQAPRLKLEERIFDFSKIKAGDIVSHEFTLTNTGQSNLNIRKTKSNCDCATARLEKEDLAPGESTKLVVTFNSTGRRGVQHKSVSIYSNDPQGPTQSVSVRATVDNSGAR